MSASAVAMMVVMLTLFWGGFAALLILALGRDARGGGGDSKGDPEGGE